MSEDVSKEDIEENKEQDENEEENNATAAFANNVNTNRTNKSTKKAFGELTFSKGDDFIVESSPKNNLPNKDNTQPQQKAKSIIFNNTEELKHQTLQFTNSNYNEISNIMNDQLLISKSSLLTNIKEVQTTNINDVNTVIANNNNNNHVVNESKSKNEMSVDNPQDNNELMKRKRNNMNSGFGEMWIAPSSLNNSVSNNNNNIINENINTILLQEQPKHQMQIQPQQVSINQSLQMINKELDIITGNINESISGGRFYNKRNNYGCSCYDASLLLRNSNNDYTQYTQNDIMKRKYNTNQPSHIHNSLSNTPTQNQIHNEYPNNNTNSILTSFRTTSKTNSRVLYNLQDSAQTNIFT